MTNETTPLIDVLILAHNEAVNLPHSISSVIGWCTNVFVIDSGSTDGSQELARQHGAQVFEHVWEGYAQQRNWGLENLPFESPWTLILDADESISEELRDQILNVVKRPPDSVPENAFYLNRITWFAGQQIRHCGYFPNWNLRLFKQGKGKYENRQVHEHLLVAGPIGKLQKGLMYHNDRRGLEHYIAKHNRYSTLEAKSLFMEIMGISKPHNDQNLPPESVRRRWLKRNFLPYLPLPGLWRFLYMYIIRLGFLDGRNGLLLCSFISQYDSQIKLKLIEVKRLYRENAEQVETTLKSHRSGLAIAEGQINDQIKPNPAPKIPSPTLQGSDLVKAPNGTITQTQPESSPWSFRAKVSRAIWMLVGRPLFRLSFHNWYCYRRIILRLFGATVGRNVVVRPSVHIEIPWTLTIEDNASIGDRAIIYSLGRIHIGKRAIISQYAHLCAGTHDYTDHTFKLLRTPITIGDDCWVGTDAFIGPGVAIGTLSVIGARSSVYKNIPAGKVAAGNPAKVIKDRELR